MYLQHTRHDALRVSLLVLLFDVGCLRKKNLLDDLPKVSDTIRSLRDFFVHPQAVLQVLLAARAAFDLLFSFHLLFWNSTFLALRCNEVCLNRGGNTVLIF